MREYNIHISSPILQSRLSFSSEGNGKMTNDAKEKKQIEQQKKKNGYDVSEKMLSEYVHL